MDLLHTLIQVMRDVVLFADHASGIHLRAYQIEVARAIVESVIFKRGLSFVVIFPRQSGKNELQAQIEAYLMVIFWNLEAEMVKISPTWKPQSLNAMRRLERILKRNLFSHGYFSKDQGYIFRLGNSRLYFLSGSPTSQVVGATASTLLECDEAQDVLTSKWDKEINPMAASTNATRVFWGTAWTSQTLLAREERAALEAEKQDGIRRVWHIDAVQVGNEVPAYKKFVESEVAKLGRNHPFVRTQFFSETIDEQGGMFPARRIALMKGDHYSQVEPVQGVTYTFLVDVAGEETDAEAVSTTRDSSVLTIMAIDFSTLADPIIHAPTYRIVSRQTWLGASHTSLYGELKALADLWQPRYIVVDATGIGEPIASFLDKAFPSSVIPFKFSQASKSDLAWKLLAIIETGRFKDHADSTDEKEAFYQQCLYTTFEIVPGPGRVVRWSVPEGTRNPINGELIHDDLVLSAALCAVLDDQPWGLAESTVIPVSDPLLEMAY